MTLCKNMTIDHEKIIASGAPCTVVKINPDGSFGESQDYNMENFKIQDWQIEALARAFLPAIQAFYESEEGKAVAAQIEEERISKGLPPASESSKKRPRRRKRR